MTHFHFYGHACFSLQQGKDTLLFDPYLTENPWQTAKANEVSCTYILVTHAHGDHLGDAVDIAKRTGATIISTAEVANQCAAAGCNVHSMHIGGTHRFSFGKVRITPAFHGSGIAGGHAAGFMVTLSDQLTLYYSGDTGVFGDMALLGRLSPIDWAILPIGDNYTMGIDDAVEAVRLLKPKKVIPIHYNTWPLIQQSPEEFKDKTEDQTNSRVFIVAPGNDLDLA